MKKQKILSRVFAYTKNSWIANCKKQHIWVPNCGFSSGRMREGGRRNSQPFFEEIGQTIRFYQFLKYFNNTKHSSGKRTLPSLQARSRRIPLGKFMANFLLSVFQPHSANQGNPYHCQASGPHCTQQLLDLHFLFGVICAFYMLYFPGPQIRASGTANPFPVVTSRFQNANKPSKTEKNTIFNGQKMKKTENMEQSFCIYKKKLDFKL